MKLPVLKSFFEKVSPKVILTSLVFITVVLSALYYGFFLNNKLSISHRVISELEAKNIALMVEIESLKKESGASGSWSL